MRTVPATRVSVRTDARGGLEILATFYMDGDKLIAQWNSEAYRTEVEAKGILAVIDGDLGRRWPSEGLLFYEAIEDAYRRSSMVIVTKLDLEQE